LHEKNGKLNEMPCHHKLEEYLDAYIKAGGIHGRTTSAGRSPASAMSSAAGLPDGRRNGRLRDFHSPARNSAFDPT
jgi:hypothetical protein